MGLFPNIGWIKDLLKALPAVWINTDDAVTWNNLFWYFSIFITALSKSPGKSHPCCARSVEDCSPYQTTSQPTQTNDALLRSQVGKLNATDQITCWRSHGVHATELGIKLIPPSEPQFTAKAGFHLPEDRLDNAAVATWAHIWLFLSCCPWTIGVQDSKLSHNGHIEDILHKGRPFSHLRGVLQEKSPL